MFVFLTDGAFSRACTLYYIGMLVFPCLRIKSFLSHIFFANICLFIIF